jgi:hypothetical protein
MEFFKTKKQIPEKSCVCKCVINGDLVELEFCKDSNEWICNQNKETFELSKVQYWSYC